MSTVVASEAWVAEAAGRLLAAWSDGRAIEPLTDEVPELAVADAYRVQARNVAQRVSAGARRTGWKIGLTSRAMQEALGVDQPDFAPLLDSMLIPDGGVLETDWLIAPRVEAEIAFVLGAPLQGAPTVEDVLAATSHVRPCLEIIDSRIAGWRLKLADTIADHASSSAFVLGAPLEPAAVGDLTTLGMAMTQDGDVVGTGAGAAVLGHPAAAVAWLARAIEPFGERLEAGEVVLSGALHAAVGLVAGSMIRARFGRGLGSVTVNVAGRPGRS